MIHRARRRLSYADDRPLFAVAVRTNRSRIPCQTQVTRYCFCLTATGSFDNLDCTIKAGRLQKYVRYVSRKKNVFCMFSCIRRNLRIDRVLLTSTISYFSNCFFIIVHQCFRIVNQLMARNVTFDIQRRDIIFPRHTFPRPYSNIYFLLSRCISCLSFEISARCKRCIVKYMRIFDEILLYIAKRN